ncbi:MAG: thioredoxin family protein [Bacteroidota bacterium]
MKFLFRILSFSLLLSVCFSQLSAQDVQGISFSKGQLAEAKARAAAENKLIFIDAYAVWCGPCKVMEKKVFTNQKVANYFNEHFINVKLDVDHEEGQAFANHHKIQYIPEFFFMDADGKIVKREKGLIRTDDFLKLAEEAQTSKASAIEDGE